MQTPRIGSLKLKGGFIFPQILQPQKQDSREVKTRQTWNPSSTISLKVHLQDVLGKILRLQQVFKFGCHVILVHDALVKVPAFLVDFSSLLDLHRSQHLFLARRVSLSLPPSLPPLSPSLPPPLPPSPSPFSPSPSISLPLSPPLPPFSTPHFVSASFRANFRPSNQVQTSDSCAPN